LDQIFSDVCLARSQKHLWSKISDDEFYSQLVDLIVFTMNLKVTHARIFAKSIIEHVLEKLSDMNVENQRIAACYTVVKSPRLLFR
jgi:hypothetical protein